MPDKVLNPPDGPDYFRTLLGEREPEVGGDARTSSEAVACRASSRTSALTTDEQLDGRSTAHRECGDHRAGAGSPALLLFVSRAGRGAVGRAGPARGAGLAAARLGCGAG